MKLSLVLATYGRTDDLARLFASLAQQTLPPHELLVMDQNPDNRVQPYVAQAAQQGLKVQHIRLPQPSLSGARNQGLQRATGDVVAFPDDDCWYEPDTLAQVAQALAANPPWAGVVAQWVEQAAARPGPYAQCPLSASAWRRFRGGDASSISLFLRRSVLTQRGGFDPRLGVGQWFGAAEETDLLLALLDAGHPLWQWPAARVHHRYTPPGGAAATPWRAQLARARGTGAIYAKHRLPPPVVLRGLLAPAAKAMWPWRGAHALRLGLATSLGRLQGAVRWAWLARKDIA